MQMNQQHQISVYLDTRRPKANGKFPVKLRVYTAVPRVQKLYPTKFEFTEDEFTRIWLTVKPRKEHKEIRDSIQAMEAKAKASAKGLNPFTFEDFERKLNRKAGDGTHVKYHYEQVINDLYEHEQVSTASNYESAQKSIIEFVESNDRKYEKLNFFDITKKWLDDYEYYMTKKTTIKRSNTTVSMYVRTLRTIYNKAIRENDISEDQYPFGGKDGYKVPATRRVKKALDKHQLGQLFNAATGNPEQTKAKDFFFFSYACNGMNFKDIAQLRYKDIKDGKKIEYTRAKTANTTKDDQEAIEVFLTDYSKTIIEKYGNANKAPKSLIFGIISDNMTAIEKQAKIKNFTRFVNQHISKLCKAVGLSEAVSTYWARHSFVTTAINEGASMAYLQRALGHKNITTTQGYFSGTDEQTKQRIAENTMKFD